VSQSGHPVKMFLASIRTDGGTQPRSTINEAIVAEYVEALKAGTKFPPVTVFHDGVDHWLGDGFHRFHAHRHADLDSISADIRSGTKRDAILYSVGANAEHGLRRSNEDKRKAVLTLLQDAEWGKWSDREIARRCSVDGKTVASVRETYLRNSSDRPGAAPVRPAPDGPEPAARTVQRGGTTYQQDTSGVSESNKQRAKNTSVRNAPAKQDSRGEDAKPAGPVATPAARNPKPAEKPKKTAKKAKQQDPSTEIESLREQLAEAMDNAQEMADQLQALTLATDPEHAQRFIEQQQYLRTVERQRDDYMRQCAELKKEVGRLRRKLGMRS